MNYISNKIYANGNELVNEIISVVRKEYTNYLSRLDSKGMLEFYEKQSAFVKKIMFYEECGNTILARRRVKSYILNFLYPDTSYYSDNFIARMEEFGEAGEKRLVMEIRRLRDELYRNNPILTDNSVPADIREEIVRKKMEKESAYKTIEKDVKDLCKYVVVACVNNVMGIHNKLEYNDAVYNICNNGNL